MRVPDQISKTVLFLGILTGGEEKYIGTGYIVTHYCPVKLQGLAASNSCTIG
jgi:hypothetical protein